MEESHRSDRSDGHKGRDTDISTPYSQSSSGYRIFEIYFTGLLPTGMFTILQADGPHVIQSAHGGKIWISITGKKLSTGASAKKMSNIPRISIIASKYPEFITVDCGPVCRPSHWQAEAEKKTEGAG